MCRVSSSSPTTPIGSPVVILRPEDWLQLGSSIKPTVAPPLPSKLTAESASRVDNPLCNISWNDNRQLPCCAAPPMAATSNQCRDQEKTRALPPPPSILRASSYKAPTSCDSIHRSENTFNLPRLVSAHDEDDSGSLLSRASSSESLQDVTSVAPQKKKKVHFFGKVSVQEFRRMRGEKDDTWYKPEDLQEFQREASLLVRQYDRAHRSFLGFFRRPHRIVHTHPALAHNSSVDDEDDDKRSIIKRVLLVDSHDLSLILFAKSFHKAFPRAVIVTAKSSHKALQLCCANNNANAFDIVVAEQRLGLFHRNNSDSGSGLFRVLHHNATTTIPYTTLFIGVSAHMERDRDLFLQSGADICWSKPPPLLNDEKKTVEELLQAVQDKKRTG